jgi:hypothetical protein
MFLARRKNMSATGDSSATLGEVTTSIYTLKQVLLVIALSHCLY